MNRSDLLLRKRNAPEQRQKRGCRGSTELPIVVPRRSWREISCGKLGTLIQQTKNSLNFVSTCLKVVDTRRKLPPWQSLILDPGLSPRNQWLRQNPIPKLRLAFCFLPPTSLLCGHRHQLASGEPLPRNSQPLCPGLRIEHKMCLLAPAMQANG